MFTEDYLQRHGAAPFSKVVMTPNGFLTDEAWKSDIAPNIAKGIRHAVVVYAHRYGIPAIVASKLLVGLGFDGFKVHLKNLSELLLFSENNILALCEHRDSSEINQAFDRLVARAGKRRASICLDQIRRSHVTPVIDCWTLILVGLNMLKDCAASRVWENSFVAVNMHPHHRISCEEWLEKIGSFVQAANKFEPEVIDHFDLLPSAWREQPFEKRQEWLAIIDDDGPTWDIDLIAKLRKAGMTLSLVSKMFKIYTAEKRIRDKPAERKPTTPKKKSQSRQSQREA